MYSFKKYLESDVWKCRKSPTGAHHWIVTESKERCKYCHKIKIVEVNRPSDVYLRKAPYKRSKKQ